MKKKLNIKIICFIIVILFICFLISSIILNIMINKKTYKIYDVSDFVKFINSKITNTEIQYNIDDESLKKGKLKITFIKDFDENINYSVDIKLNNNKIGQVEINNINEEFLYDLKKEGTYDLNLTFFRDEKEKNNETKKIVYIKPYEKQFCDEYSNKGTGLHLWNTNYLDNLEKSATLLIDAGIKNVRTDIGLYDDNQLINTVKNSGEYRTDYYDKFTNYLYDKNINILMIFNTKTDIFDNKVYPKTESDCKKILQPMNYFIDRYNKVESFEILNEINYKYKTADEVKDYANLINKVVKQNNEKNIVIGAFATDEKNALSPFEFIRKLDKNLDDKNVIYSYHLYENNSNSFAKKIQQYENVFNEIGGFQKEYLSEYGFSSTWGLQDITQAENIVKQNVIIDNSLINKAFQYNFRNSWTDYNNTDANLGLLNEDYSPKKSYYSEKNYNTNTNGAEYIGFFTLQDGITAYVYDKDGKPKIIIWSDNGAKKIYYKDFKASDLYGNEISADENNQLTVSYSPIYLDNVSTSYFYKAILNSITSGYSEFNTKFADEISKVDGLTAKINDLNNQAVNLKNVSTLDETKVNELMKEHFELGNMVMSAYENGKLNVKYVKLSSMLDSLNTIGNSFEDLVTVSAKTRITNLTDITNEVNTAKSLAQDNEKFDIVYPNKIYQFAQDLIDTSSYILGLEEENDIKTGLINSKTLHAKYLAEWSQEFSKIYMKDALKNSINNILNNNEKLENTNKSVLANKDISYIYNEQEQELQNILNNPEKNNVDIINKTFDNQINISDCKKKKYINKEIDINSEELYEILNNEFNNLNNYSELYKYYLNEDNIDNNEIEIKLNKVIDRYNNNLDIDLNEEAKIINNIKDIYDNKINSESISDNYLNKLIINKNTELVSQLIENKIKNTADKEFQTINIEDCDLNKITNKDVNVKLKLPNNKSQITNNDGKESVQFTQNGEFTFDINIRGYDYQYKVKVSNIDKESPKINIKNTNNTLSASATDDNLMEMYIERDGMKIEKNKNIIEPGIYKITAIDKANNQSVEKTIIFGNYQDNNENKKYIPIDKIETKVKEIKENSNFIIKENGQDVEDDSLIKTGDTLINNNQSYTLIVKGDLTNSGKADVLSLIKLRKVLVSIDNLDKIGKIAADLNNDYDIDVIDLINLRKKIVGIE